MTAALISSPSLLYLHSLEYLCKLLRNTAIGSHDRICHLRYFQDHKDLPEDLAYQETLALQDQRVEREIPDFKVFQVHSVLPGRLVNKDLKDSLASKDK